MSLIDEVLSEERRVLSQLGCDLNEKNADKNYPDRYFKDYSYNLFLEMSDRHKEEYGGGSGGELNAKGKTPAKMASIRSSSAMTFNLLGNDSIKLLESNMLGHCAGRYRIEYEKQLETIHGIGRQQPANLDAFLGSEDGAELIFCEMKMLEWFSRNHGKLKPAYKDENNYRHKGLYPVFMTAIESLERMSLEGMFEYYDVWQMFKHVLAINNYMHENEGSKYGKVTLLNVVFEPGMSFMSDKAQMAYAYQGEKEHKGFECFRNALKEAGIIGEGKCFDVKYVPVREFIKNFEMSDAKIRYLSRYVL